MYITTNRFIQNDLNGPFWTEYERFLKKHQVELIPPNDSISEILELARSQYSIKSFLLEYGIETFRKCFFEEKNFVDCLILTIYEGALEEVCIGQQFLNLQ